jgi:hypothetical protein
MISAVLLLILIFGGSFMVAKVLNWLRDISKDMSRFVIGVIRYFGK